MNEDMRPDPHVVKRPPSGLWVVALAATLVVVGIVWAYQPDVKRAERFDAAGPLPGATEGSVGTSGSGDAPEIEGDGGQPPVVPPAIIQELDTITGSVDGQELIGRRVDLHVVVHSVPNEVAFWIGQGDNRVLVVLGRDNRGGKARQIGSPARHGISPVHAGQQATISGSVQKLPKAEEMHNWRLAKSDFAEVLDRKLYIRADTVTTNGHGTH